MTKIMELIPISNPIVTIEMENGGVIRAELYPEVAPNTVRNFVSLVQVVLEAVCGKLAADLITRAASSSS